jgi:hypothetical protein
MAASHDQHSRGDQFVADMMGGPGEPGTNLDAGSFGEDVVTPRGHLA